MFQYACVNELEADMERQELFEKTKTAFADRQAKNKRCHYPDELKRDAIMSLTTLFDAFTLNFNHVK